MAKLRITFKDPDRVGDAVREHVRAEVDALEGLSKREREFAAEERQYALSDKLERWFSYGEYVTIEVDTEAMTATVVAKRDV